jgi:hypothetical protein
VAAKVSYKYSPCKITLDRELDFEKHCKAIFGSFLNALSPFFNLEMKQNKKRSVLILFEKS